MITLNKRDRGRPPITEDQKKDILHKVEPYLKSGLSVRKALSEAKIPNSTFYHLMNEDEHFREQIDTFRNFVSVLLNNTLVRELMTIIDKQNGNEARNIKSQPLNRDDIAFLQWFALKSNLTKEEWGDRENVSLFDPETEIQKVKRMIDESTTKEIDHS